MVRRRSPACSSSTHRSGILLVLALSARSACTASCSPAGRRARSTRCSARSAASAQMISYEAALGLSLAAVLLMSGTLIDVRHRRAARTASPTGTSSSTGFVPFVIFLIATTAELNRPPFDLVEAEQELVGGLQHRVLVDPVRPVLPRRVHERDHDERRHRHAVPRWPAAARVGDFDIFGSSAGRRSSGTIWFVLKVLAFLYIYVWFRATLPRLRYDQLMDFGWKLLIPVALGLVPAARRAAPVLDRTATPPTRSGSSRICARRRRRGVSACSWRHSRVSQKNREPAIDRQKGAAY